MKKFLLFLFVMLVGNSIRGYSQSFDYTRYYNQLMQKAQNMGNEISRESQRMSQLATSPTNKDIYVLYCNGQKMGNFPDEWSCKAHINSIKTQLNSYVASIIDGLPAQYRTEARNAINGYINQINFTYRKESNPNYRPSGNNRLNANNNTNNSNMSDYFQKANQYYKEHGGYSPFSQNNKETPDASKNNTQENQSLESLIASGNNKKNVSKTIEDILAVKSDSPSQTEIINQLQGGNSGNDKKNQEVAGAISLSGTTVNSQQNTPLKPVTSDKLVVNTQQNDEEKMAYLNRENRIAQKTDDFQDKLYKQHDAEIAAQNAPGYDKIIDEYNANMSNGKNVGPGDRLQPYYGYPIDVVGVAYAEKGAVDVYSKVKDEASEDIDVLKDMATGKTYNDPYAKKEAELTYSGYYSLLSDAPTPLSKPFSIISDALKQDANGSVSSSDLVTDAIKDAAKDKVTDKITGAIDEKLDVPVVSNVYNKANTLTNVTKDGSSTLEHGWLWFNYTKGDRESERQLHNLGY